MPFIDIVDFLTRVFLPLLCILIFTLHSVGRHAFVYSFYWFIPVFLYFYQSKKRFVSIFAASLSSTFVAHAVGSIIWLYFVDMTCVQWLALIPRVAVERLVFVLGLSGTYIFIKYLLCNVKGYGKCYIKSELQN